MNKQQNFQKRSCAVVAIAVLMALASGAAQAAITSAYDLTPVAFPYSMAFNQTGPDAVSIDISTPGFPMFPGLTKAFDTDGVGGTLVLTETITNSGTTAWSSWSESVWDQGDEFSMPGMPGANVSWGSASSSVAGSFSTDSTTGITVFSFATALAAGDSFVLTKSINYADNVWSVGVEEQMALAVPEASTYGMMLAGLSLISWVSRRKKIAA